MSAALGKMAFLGMLALKLQVDAAKDTKSPNPPIPKPECDASIPVSIRYSSVSERLYLESADGKTRGGCVTLEQIWEHQRGEAPLYAVDAKSGDISDSATGTWLLTEELFVEDGITLKVHGSSASGDADELRLLSTSDTFINLRAHGGSLDFLSTKVFSWDSSSNGPDKDESDGRSFAHQRRLGGHHRRQPDVQGQSQEEHGRGKDGHRGQRNGLPRIPRQRKLRSDVEGAWVLRGQE
ncbi:unnamed protein product [Laminaria digitata]